MPSKVVYANRKKNGLCGACGKPLDREASKCSKCAKANYKHRDKYRKSEKGRKVEQVKWRKRIITRRENNKCTTCSAPLDVFDTTTVTCPNCSEKANRNKLLRRNLF